MITFQCPSCFHEMRAREALLGKKVRCKECNSAVTVEVYEPPADLEDQFVLGKTAPARSLRKKKRAEGPGRIALRLAVDYSGYIILGALLIAAFIGICIHRTFAAFGFAFFGFLGVIACAGAYAWALIQASAEEPMSLLGFILPRYGLKMIIRNRAGIQGPLPVFCAGLGALALAAISLRIGVAQPIAEERRTASTVSSPPRKPVKAAETPAPEVPVAKPPPKPPAPPLLGGPTPVPTEPIESLTVLKRGMNVWLYFGRWEKGSVVGRNGMNLLIVRKLDGFMEGKDVIFPLEHFRIEAAELAREDLADVVPLSDEPTATDEQLRALREDAIRSQQKPARDRNPSRR